MQELEHHHEYTYNNHFLNILSEKVETRIKDLHNNRQLIIGINSIEEFILSKIKLTQFCFDVEDDFREMLQKYKGLFISCKELQEKNHLLAKTIKNFEIKNSNLEKIQDDFKQNINDLVTQIGFLKEKQINNEDYISYLEQKAKLTERSFGRRNNSLIGDYTNRERSRDNFIKAERVIRNDRERSLYDLSYVNNNNFNSNEKNDMRNLNLNQSGNNINFDYKQNFNPIENDRDYVKNKGDFVERFLSNHSYTNKGSIEAQAQKSPYIDSHIKAGNNLIYDSNYYNNTVEDNRAEANVNCNDDNYIGNKFNFEFLDNIENNNINNNKRPISKTIDYEENDKVNICLFIS